MQGRAERDEYGRVIVTQVNDELHRSISSQTCEMQSVSRTGAPNRRRPGDLRRGRYRGGQ